MSRTARRRADEDGFAASLDAAFLPDDSISIAAPCYAPGSPVVADDDPLVDMESAESLFVSTDAIRAAVAAETAALQAAEFARRRREEAGLSQTDLAAILGVSQARISKLENAEAPRGPSLEVLARIAEACGGELILGFRRSQSSKSTVNS